MSSFIQVTTFNKDADVFWATGATIRSGLSQVIGTSTVHVHTGKRQSTICATAHGILHTVYCSTISKFTRNKEYAVVRMILYQNRRKYCSSFSHAISFRLNLRSYCTSSEQISRLPMNNSCFLIVEQFSNCWQQNHQ